MKVEDGNTVYDSRNNCNAIIETGTNELISGCKNTVIPNSVTSIGMGAFGGCSGLTSVTIPNSVTSIEWRSFEGCSGLTSVISLIEKPFAIYYVFPDDTYNSATLFVPAGTTDAYKATVGWCEFNNIKEIEVSIQQGDVNGDQTVDVADISSVIGVMAQSGNDAAADVNKDGTVDVADISAVIVIMANRARR